MQISVCVWVNCIIFTIIPDSSLSFFILAFRWFANNLHYVPFWEGVSVC